MKSIKFWCVAIFLAFIIIACSMQFLYSVGKIIELVDAKGLKGVVEEVWEGKDD